MSAATKPRRRFIEAAPAGMRQTGWRAVFPWERRHHLVEGIDFGKADEILVPHGYDLHVTIEAKPSPALRRARKQGLTEVPNPNTLARRK